MSRGIMPSKLSKKTCFKLFCLHLKVFKVILTLTLLTLENTEPWIKNMTMTDRDRLCKCAHATPIKLVLL